MLSFMNNAATAAQAIDRSIRQNGAIVQLEYNRDDYRALLAESDRSYDSANGVLFSGEQRGEEWAVRMSK
jgi:hypothetical protein